MGVDEETTSTHVKDRPSMGGEGMAISSLIPDVAPEAPNGSVTDTRTVGGLQNTEGEDFDLPGLYGLSSEFKVEAISTTGPYGGSRLLPESLRCVAGGRGGTVVKVLCYKSEGRWFDRSLFQNFSLT